MAMALIRSKRLHSVAEEAVKAAGHVARTKFRQPLQISDKGFRDYVTDADIAAQETITSVIRTAFPDHGFITEEDDSSLPGNGPIIWIVDPIDGTTNYSRRVPLFCVSLAAVVKKPTLKTADVLVGAIYDPMRDELFSATADGQCLLNGRPIRVSKISDLALATIGTDWNRTGNARQLTLDTVNSLVHHVDAIPCYNSAALALAWVAMGRIDGYFNFSLMPWDVAAASLLIQKSGGKLSGLAGQPITLEAGSLSCLASNGRLHDQLLQYMPNDNGLLTK